jgi:uncharacterized protein
MGKTEVKTRLQRAVKDMPHSGAIKSLALFGSYVNGTPGHESDVDVLIDFVPSAVVGYFELFDIQSHLESVVGTKIDLVTPQAISKYFRDQVLAQAEVIYER